MSKWKTDFSCVVGATAPVVAGSFARRKYEERVLEIGHEFRTGEVVAREGGYQCEQCGYVLSLAAGKCLPPCPKCAHSRFLKISEPDDPATSAEVLRGEGCPSRPRSRSS